MDVPLKVETPTNIYDKRSKIKGNMVVIPKYDLRICRKNWIQKIYYKKKLIFNSSKFIEEKVNFFSELYSEKHIVILLKPSKDAIFHNPISVQRGKILIIDFFNNPEYIYEVDLKGYLLLPSKKVLEELIDYNISNDIIVNKKKGIIYKIDLVNKTLTVQDYNKTLVIFDLVKRENILN